MGQVEDRRLRRDWREPSGTGETGWPHGRRLARDRRPKLNLDAVLEVQPWLVAIGRWQSVEVTVISLVS
jgi:hypothetical protein